MPGFKSAPSFSDLKKDKKGNKDRAQKKGGWFPDELSPADRKLYDAHTKKYGKATNTWADGSPRNPMPEIREQSKHDNSKRPRVSWDDKRPRVSRDDKRPRVSQAQLNRIFAAGRAAGKVEAAKRTPAQKAAVKKHNFWAPPEAAIK